MSSTENTMKDEDMKVYLDDDFFAEWDGTLEELSEFSGLDESRLKFYEVDLWEKVREKRNLLLSESDWALMPDSPLSETQLTEVTTYRQTLRNLPQTYSSPENVIWPETPDVLLGDLR